MPLSVFTGGFVNFICCFWERMKKTYCLHFPWRWSAHSRVSYDSHWFHWKRFFSASNVRFYLQQTNWNSRRDAFSQTQRQWKNNKDFHQEVTDWLGMLNSTRKWRPFFSFIVAWRPENTMQPIGQWFTRLFTPNWPALLSLGDPFLQLSSSLFWIWQMCRMFLIAFRVTGWTTFITQLCHLLLFIFQLDCLLPLFANKTWLKYKWPINGHEAGCVNVAKRTAPPGTPLMKICRMWFHSVGQLFSGHRANYATQKIPKRTNEVNKSVRVKLMTRGDATCAPAEHPICQAQSPHKLLVKLSPFLSVAMNLHTHFWWTKPKFPIEMFLLFCCCVAFLTRSPNRNSRAEKAWTPPRLIKIPEQDLSCFLSKVSPLTFLAISPQEEKLKNLQFWMASCKWKFFAESEHFAASS